MNKLIKLLYVNCIPEQAEKVLEVIRDNGIDFSHVMVSTKSDFIESLISFVPDIIISDYSLPTINVMDILSVRNEIAPYTPLIIIAETEDDDIAVECMKSGADDYISLANLKRLPVSIISSRKRWDWILLRINAERDHENIQKKEQLLIKVLDDINAVYILVDKSGMIVSTNKSTELILGWTRKEVIGSPISQVFNEQFDAFAGKVMDEVMSRGIWQGELNISKKDREKIRLMLTVTDLKNDEENRSHGIMIVGFRYSDCNIGNNISSPDNIAFSNEENNIKSYQFEKLSSVDSSADELIIDTAMKSSRIGILRYDILENNRYLDREGCYLMGLDYNSYGRTEDEFLSKIHPDDRKELKLLFHLAISKRKDFEAEFRVIWNDSSIHYLSTWGRIASDEDNNPIKINGLIWEITDQKLLEISLRENMRRTNSIINNLNGVVFRYRFDSDKKLEYISEGVNDITGYPAWNFLLNQPVSLSSLILPEDRSKVREQVDLAIRDRVPYTMEYRIKSSAGKIKWLWERGHGVYLGARPIAIEGFISDITDRKNVESKLNKSLKRLQQLNQYIQTVREKERVAISRELHDDLGQALTAVNIDLSSLKNNLDKTEDAKNRIDKISVLVTNTIKSVQRLTSTLRPQMIIDLGLEAAIENYVKEFEERTKIRVNLSLHPLMGIHPDVSLVIFRIMQESLTNIARHSQATQAGINLWVHEGNIHFDITDNGIGIKTNDRKSRQSFGLISMSERALSLGGKLKIASRKGGGTIISLLLPLRIILEYENTDL
jgi:PAS domain S-box-containing protein